MVNEVRQIEGKVLDISRLQEIFTKNVLVQLTATCVAISVFLVNCHVG